MHHIIGKDTVENKLIKDYYFKVNDSKLDNPETLEHQLKKVIDRIKNKNNDLDGKITVKMGTVDDDIFQNRFRARIRIWISTE